MPGVDANNYAELGWATYLKLIEGAKCKRELEDLFKKIKAAAVI